MPVIHEGTVHQAEMLPGLQSINSLEKLEIDISCLYVLYLNRISFIFRIILVLALLRDINEIFHNKNWYFYMCFCCLPIQRQTKSKISSHLTNFSSFLDEQYFSFQEKEVWIKMLCWTQQRARKCKHYFGICQEWHASPLDWCHSHVGELHKVSFMVHGYDFISISLKQIKFQGRDCTISTKSKLTIS